MPLTDQLCLASRSFAKQWFSKHRWEEIVEKEKKTRPHPNRMPGFAIKRNDSLRKQLPLFGDIRHAWIHCASTFAFVWHGHIECKFHQRDELVHWLVLGQLSR